MLKAYAEFYRLREGSISATALTRVKWMTVLSLPFVPAMIASRTLPDQGGSLFALLQIATVVGFVATGALCLTRVVNRFWARDLYLDEWELRIKRRSMTFSFQTTITTLSVVGPALFVLPLPQWMEQGAATGEFMFVSAAVVVYFAFYAQIFHVLANVRPVDDRLEPLPSVS